MQIRTLMPRHSGYLCFTLIILSILLLHSCKKTDIAQELPTTPDIAVKKNFFSIDTNVNPVVVRVAKEIQDRDHKKQFTAAFAQKNGYPVWNKSIVKLTKKKQPNNFGNGDSALSDTLIYIPLVLENTQYVNGYILAKISNSTYLSLHLAQYYKAYPFGTNVSTDSITAEKYALQIMQLDNEVFGGNREYVITDKRLFNYNREDTSGVSIKIRFPNMIPVVAGNKSYNGLNNFVQTACVDITTTTMVATCRTVNYCNSKGGCDRCAAYCYPKPKSTTQTFCESWWVSEGGSTGGSGSGGSGGGIPSSYPCPTPPGPPPVSEPLYEPADPNCPPPAPGTGWVQQVPIVKIYSVTNNINPDFPCLVNAFNDVTALRLVNCIYKLYSDTYVGNNKVHNLEILSIGYLVDANNIPVETKSRVKPNDSSTYQIALNESFGLEYTKEYWSAIILHELVHGFIQKNELNFSSSSTFGNTHQTMLMIWVEDIKQALMDIYPSMSQQDALCLSITGMSDMFTDDVNDTFRYEMTQWMQQHYNVNATILGSTKDAYQNGVKGTSCN